MTGWLDARQVPLYLGAMAAGVAVGALLPGGAPILEAATTPVLSLLLFATFLAVPLVEIARSLRDIRFLGVVVGVNFLVVPIVAFALSRFVTDDRGLLVGVLLVLLTPCVDYVIVFTGLAGGDRARLLAATPLLMLLQLLLLPAYLLLFAGPDLVRHIDPAPFVEAFLVLIVLPLAAAALVQAVARRHRAGRTVEVSMAAAMVPLMMLTLCVVIASQVAALGQEAVTALRLVPLYVVFLVVMIVVGVTVSRVVRLDAARARAATFGVVTRNSLVVLPLALSLPPAFALAPLAVVTQTLVELIGMVVMVRLVPKLIPERGRVIAQR
ncbi:bile acid:sodium symporter [Salinibacterium sp. GXW1014]|uniref:bile acid:sodium symporter n=1 Tax=Salinibacterium sp. GXW1014 TaxID=3377838 RepID=UPI003839F287